MSTGCRNHLTLSRCEPKSLNYTTVGGNWALPSSEALHSHSLPTEHVYEAGGGGDVGFSKRLGTGKPLIISDHFHNVDFTPSDPYPQRPVVA